METGKIYQVYQDPLTKEIPEGKARLIKIAIGDPEDDIAFCNVRFIEGPDQDCTFQRWVCAEDLIS